MIPEQPVTNASSRPESSKQPLTTQQPVTTASSMPGSSKQPLIPAQPVTNASSRQERSKSEDHSADRDQTDQSAQLAGDCRNNSARLTGEPSNSGVPLIAQTKTVKFLPTSINLKVNHVSHVINDAAKYSP